MSPGTIIPNAAIRRAMGLGPVPLDRLVGGDGDWIGRHRCLEAEILGPLREAEAEMVRCWGEIEHIEETILDPRAELRSVGARLRRAEAIYRRLIVRRVRRFVTLSSHVHRDGAFEVCGIRAYRPTFYWLLLNEVLDLRDVATDALASFRLRCALATGRAAAVTLALSSILLGHLLRALAAIAEGLAPPPPDTRVDRVLAAGGDTCLYIPRA